MTDMNAWLLIVSVIAVCSATGVYGVRFGCRICAGFVPSIKESAIAIGLFCLAYTPLTIINAVPAIKANLTAQILLFVAGLSISALILGARLKPQDGCSIGFKKGFLVSLVWSGFGFVVIAVGTAVVAGVFMLYGAIFSAPKPQDFQPAPQTHEAVPSKQAAPQVAGSEQQRLLSGAAREIIARFPQLDPSSPMVDQPGIDYVVSKRDAYIANGHEVDIALRMAANDYGEQIAASQQREAAQRYAQQITSQRFNQPSVSQAQPVTNDYIRRKNEPCQASAVMTDEEIARCRSR
ncbi:MAG: hypothetical protein E6R09_02745 [Rhodocyclaceae bacterium]|nr:MAG: hypothetical protein E6R09_02745 [Rhodocyclaceae bacterium]